MQPPRLGARNATTGLGGFTGRVLHSSAYADPSSVGERVLIVGFGESGGDIAHELACAGRDVYLSVRNGVTLLERADLNGTPADFFTPRAKYLLPNAVQQGLDNWLVFGGQPFGHQIRAWRYPRRTNPWDTFFVKSSPLTPYLGSRVVPKPGVTAVDGASVHFTDGTRHDVDTILLCTGYRAEVPILGRPFRLDYRELYHTVFHPDWPNLAFVGFVRPNFGAIPPMAEAQARWAARVLAGTRCLPSRARMRVTSRGAALAHAADVPQIHDRLPYLFKFRSSWT